MVICVIALVVFGILGIFSATHRQMAREAFDCVFRKMTMRPCNTGLDRRLRMIVSMKVMSRHEGAGKFVHRNFEAISFAFMILMLGSFVFSGIGLYNYWAFGNCNGPNSSELCLLNPETYSNTNPLAWLFPPNPADLKPVSYDGLPMAGNPDAEVKIVEVGCFTCPFTKGAEPIVREMLGKYEGKVAFYFKYFPLPRHDYSFEAAEAAECAREQGKFWEYKDILFERLLECSQAPDTGQLMEHYKRYAGDLNMNSEQFNACLYSGKYKEYVEKQKQEAIAAGIYGTPTFFINGRPLVAPKAIEEFSAIIDEELGK